MGKSISDFSSVTTVGLDPAKHVFQIHGIDASGARCGRQSDEAQQAIGVFRFVAALSGRARGLRIGASLGAGTDQAWP